MALCPLILCLYDEDKRNMLWEPMFLPFKIGIYVCSPFS